MKKLIIMNGCGGSGKDTFVKLCRENSSLKTDGWCNWQHTQICVMWVRSPRHSPF